MPPLHLPSCHRRCLRWCHRCLRWFRRWRIPKAMPPLHLPSCHRRCLRWCHRCLRWFRRWRIPSFHPWLLCLTVCLLRITWYRRRLPSLHHEAHPNRSSLHWALNQRLDLSPHPRPQRNRRPLLFWFPPWFGLVVNSREVLRASPLVALGPVPQAAVGTTAHERRE